MSTGVPTGVSAVVPTGTLPIRGAIRATIEGSTDGIVAGREFSVFVTIQNPFEVPITVHQVSTHLPTELVDLEQIARAKRLAAREEQLAELQESARAIGVSVPAGMAVAPRPKKKSQGWSMKFSMPFLSPINFEYESSGAAGRAVARDIGSEAAGVAARVNLPFLGSTEIKKHLESHQGEEQVIKDQLEHELNLHQSALEEEKRDPHAGRQLQPGNSITKVFTLQTRKTVWFRPSTYRLQIQIRYDIEGAENFDAIPHTIQIKSSLLSVVFGALAGWIVKEGSSGLPGLAGILRLVVSLVMAAMAVVLFARKKDVQPVIAVEDFWGGVAIGFLSAYMGPAMLDGLLPGAEST